MKIKCKKCGHEWITRLEGKKPLKCPKCMNPNWNKKEIIKNANR